MFSLVSHPGGPDDPPVSATDGDFNHTRFFLVQHSSNLIQHSYGKSSCWKFAKHMFRCSGTQGCLFIINLAGCLMLGCPIHGDQLQPKWLTQLESAHHTLSDSMASLWLIQLNASLLEMQDALVQATMTVPSALERFVVLLHFLLQTIMARLPIWNQLHMMSDWSSN